MNIKLGQVSVNSNKQLYNPGKSLFMGKIYQKSSHFMMTAGFSCLGINFKNLGGESVLSLRLSFRFLSVFYHIFPVMWLQPDSFHKNMIHCVIYYMLGDVLWTSFPVWEEGQAGCGDVLEALAAVSVSRFGSVSRQCMWGRACASGVHALPLLITSY